MRKTIVAVLAHPDDEAFGPGGTLAKYSKTHDVYILCATKGEAGNNHTVREDELLKSAKILGVKKVLFLGCRDGTLCNNMYHEIAVMIEKHLIRLKPEIIITFEPRGVSGHIDHIAISMITTFVFNKLSFVKTLMYFCVTENYRKFVPNYYIYFPPGYKANEIDRVVDLEDVWEKKIQAMMAHQSQRKDLDRVLPLLKLVPKKEYFLLTVK